MECNRTTSRIYNFVNGWYSPASKYQLFFRYTVPLNCGFHETLEIFHILSTSEHPQSTSPHPCLMFNMRNGILILWVFSVASLCSATVWRFVYIFKCDLSFQILLVPLYMYCSEPFNLCASYRFGLVMIPPTHECVCANVQQMGRKRGGPWWEKGWANQIYHSKYLFTRWALLIHLSLLYKQRLLACVLHMRITVCEVRGCVWGHWVTEVSHAWDTNAGSVLWRDDTVGVCLCGMQAQFVL